MPARPSSWPNWAWIDFGLARLSIKRQQLSNSIHAHHHRPGIGPAQAQGLARIDAQMLLLHLLGRPVNDRAWLLTHRRRRPGARTMDSASHRAVPAPRGGEPVAYLTGQREFYGLPLAVDARVLDPRPDTETLVAWALEVLAPACPRIADLGTGSGAIALALQMSAATPACWPWTPAQTPLAVARANAERLGLPVRLQHGNWLAQHHRPV